MRSKPVRKSVKRVLGIASASAVAMLLRPQTAHADYTWTAGTGNWSTGVWIPSTPAFSDTADTLSFTGAGGAMTDDLLSTVSSLIFAGSAGYSLAAGGTVTTLSINGGGITNNVNFASTISQLLEILPSTSSTFTNNGTGSLLFSNTSTTGAITVDQAATLSFVNSSAGVISIAGTVLLASGSSLINNSGTVTNTIAGSSTNNSLSLAGGNTISVSSGILTDANALTESGTGTNSFLVTGGTLSLKGGATLTGTDVFSIGSGATLATSKLISASASTISIAAGGSLSGSQTIVAESLLDSGKVAFFQLTIGAGGTLSVGSNGVLTSSAGSSAGTFGAGASLVSSGSITGKAWTLGSSTTTLSFTGGSFIASNLSGTLGTGGMSISGGANVSLGEGYFTLAGTGAAISIASGTLSINSPSLTLFPTVGANTTVAIGDTTSGSTNSALLSVTPSGGVSSKSYLMTTNLPVNFQNVPTAVATLQLVPSTYTNINLTEGLLGGGSNSTLLISGSGTGYVTDAVSTNTFAGTTEIQGGTLSLVTASNLLASNSQIIVGDTVADSAGTLDITGLTAASYSINSGQVLSGYGTIVSGTKSLVIASSATLRPGDAPGVLSVSNSGAGNLSIAPGSKLVYDLSGSSAADMVAVNGALAFGGTAGNLVNLSLTSVTLPPLNTSATYEIFTYGTYAGDTSIDIADDFNITLNGSSSGVYSSVASVDVTDPAGLGQIDVTITSVPEPASLSLLALGGIGLLSRRRRKDRKPQAASGSNH